MHSPERRKSESTPSSDHTLHQTLTEVANFFSATYNYSQFYNKVISQLRTVKQLTFNLKAEVTNIKSSAQTVFTNLHISFQQKLAAKQIKNQKGINQDDYKATMNQQDISLFQQPGTSLFQQPGTCKDQQKQKIILNYRIKQKLSDQYNILRKQKDIPTQIYICFLCFQKQEKENMWTDPNLFLTHMKQLHGKRPELEPIYNKQGCVSCSHVFIQGNLVNLMKNHQSGAMFYLFFLFKNKKYDQLYFCNCSLNRQRIPIFMEQNHFKIHFLSSIRHTHLKCSHIALNKSKACEKNPLFHQQQIPTTYAKAISTIKHNLHHQINKFSLFSCLRPQPYNILEFMSCHPNIIPPKRAYFPFYFCTKCQSYIVQAKIYRHYRKWHSGEALKKGYGSYAFNREIFLIKSQAKRIQRYNCTQTNNFDHLSLQEKQIVKTQLVMIKDFTIQKQSMVCGQCSQVFTNTPDKYINHVILEHQLHPRNTHLIAFLMNNQQVQSNQSLSEEEQQQSQ